MIDLYAYTTPNSVKVPIMLEEVGAECRLIKVNIRAVKLPASVTRANVRIGPRMSMPHPIRFSNGGTESVRRTASSALRRC